MKTAVITFGRFNPPHIGHLSMFEFIKSVAKENNAVATIFVSQNEKGEQNPLPIDFKLEILRKSIDCQFIQAHTFIDILKDLEKQGFTKVICVFGSDRIEQFKTTIDKYSGKEFSFCGGITCIEFKEQIFIHSRKIRELIRNGEFNVAFGFLSKNLTKADKEQIIDYIFSKS